MTSEARPRVLLVDDHLPLLSALEDVLRNDCDVIGRATTIAALMEQVQAQGPDVLVLDLNLPDGNGIEASTRVLAIRPDAVIIILTALDDEGIDEAARRAGAFACVSKFDAQSQLIPAIRAACDMRQAAQFGSTTGPT